MIHFDLNADFKVTIAIIITTYYMYSILFKKNVMLFFLQQPFNRLRCNMQVSHE